MKNLKKFAALLLVGAMALLMLTACGGGGGSVNNPEEQKVLTQIGNQKGVQVTNDAQLRAVAKAQLDEDLNGQFNVLGYAGAFRINKKQVGNDLAIVITARYDYQNTLLNVVLTEISKYVDTKVDASVNQDGIWSNVGSAAITSRAISLSLSALRTTTVPQVNNNFSSFLPGVWLQSCPPGLFCACWQGRGPGPFLRCDKSCRLWYNKRALNTDRKDISMQLFVTGPTWRRGWMPARSSICPSWYNLRFTSPAGPDRPAAMSCR